MKNVLIIHKSMPQYRVDFFYRLKDNLIKEGVELNLIYGQINTDGKDDLRQVDFGKYKKNKVINWGGISLIWQPCLKEIKNADLVIVEQANKLLINYVLLVRKLFGLGKFAFWGHGHNMQSKETSLFNLFKKSYSNYTDYWFAYTNNVKKRLVANGFDEKKITVVENAIDTKTLKHYYDSISEAEMSNLKNELSISNTEKVFIYCGALYKEKRLEFLIEAADRIFNQGNKFKLLIVGGGSDADIIKNAATNRPWLKFVGPKFEREKALYFKISDLFLMPGAIGLAVLDAFAFSTPMITTNYEFHGPEYEYIVHDYNGIVTENSMDDYVTQLEIIINDSEKLKSLKENSALSSGMFTIEKMVDNFTAGIINALNKCL